MRFSRAVVALSLVLAACSSSAASEPSTTTTRPSTTTTLARTTTTTRAPTSTTTTMPLGPISPITGLTVEDSDLLARGALVVKIDNHPNARPQAGLSEADAVIELMVEGITRLAAVYHTGDAEVVGPIRSMRPTDGQLARLFDAPLITSGGQDWVVAQIRDTATDIIGEVGSPQTFRSSNRRAPHNLYGDTMELREFADRRGYLEAAPQPLWAFGEMPEDAEPAGTIDLRFASSHTTAWEWDGSAYLKTTNGSVHRWTTPDGRTEQITVQTLVVLEMRTYTQSPPPGGGPAKAVESVGRGEAYVFGGGTVTAGTWERDTLSEQFTLTSEDGTPMLVPPGTVWISFFDSDMTVRWEE